MADKLDYLADPSDPRVKAALRETCGICHRPPGQHCRHPWETDEPMNRVVHQERAEAKMHGSKRFK